MTAAKIFDAAAVTLQSGAVLPAVRVACVAPGTLSAARDNAIVFVSRLRRDCDRYEKAAQLVEKAAFLDGGRSKD